MRCSSLLAVAFGFLAVAPAPVIGNFAKTTSKQLELSWFFQWPSADPTQPGRTVPITAQCDTLDITWSRGAATGPDPIGPTFLQIYSSSGKTPLVVPFKDLRMNLTIPFDVGTSYMICMFDSVGNTGGCQDLFTVYTAPNNTTALNSTTCPPLTFPTNKLGVKVTKASGGDEISSQAFIDQCTDMVLTPQNGTPPFNLTIASPLRPPLNITSNSMDPIAWTMDRVWGQPFFLSMVDSKGLTWAEGPLHGGGPGSTDCLAPSNSKSTQQKYTAGVVGSVFGGLILGALLCFCGELLRRRYTQRVRAEAPPQWSQPAEWEKFPVPAPASATIVPSGVPIPVPIISSPPGARVRGSSTGLSTTNNTGSSSARQVNPFLDRQPSATAGTPRKHGLPRSPYPDESQPRTPESSITLGRSVSASESGVRGEGGSGQQVYVIHADGGTVIELPPTYVPAGPSRSASLGLSKIA